MGVSFHSIQFLITTNPIPIIEAMGPSKEGCMCMKGVYKKMLYVELLESQL